MTQRPGKAADTRSLGQRGEEAAAGFLERRGWSIRDRNYRIREGEIDIIAVKGGEVSFVEVKTRRSGAFGTPGMAVTYAKQDSHDLAVGAGLFLRDSVLLCD